MKLVMAVVLIWLSFGCQEMKNTNKEAQREQQITEAYQSRLNQAVPYPLAQMHDSLERRNIRERLLRFNNPAKIGYVYLFTPMGQMIGYYTIKGKVTSTQSQMTVPQTVVCPDVYDKGGTLDPYFTIDAMGDDGSYGPNEGGDDGIFFFTTEGVMLSWNGLWLYSDAPLSVDVKPLTIYDATTAKPSSTAELP